VAPAAAAPVAPPVRAQVLDVTPSGLGIGTVAGFCETLIRRNTRIPTEVTRNFRTSRDGQRAVKLAVCLGESARLGDNVLLGELVLDGLEPRPRGETAIAVTFAIDLDGRLQVRARDVASGREQRATLEVVGAQSPTEVAAARERLRGLTS
jgi:molecular chaperone DnaK